VRSLNFQGKVLVIGCGAVSRCTLPLVLKELEVAPERVKVVDFVDNRELISDLLKAGVLYEHIRITPENFARILSSWLSNGDVLID
jgi:homospermidine synthase